MMWEGIRELLEPLGIIDVWREESDKVSVKTLSNDSPNRFTIEKDAKYPYLFAVEFFHNHSPKRTCNKLEKHEILWVVRRYCGESR